MDSITIITDEKIANIWIEHASKTGDADACYNVGLLFYHGQGLDVDEEEARYWFTKSAEQGHMEASTNLGVIFAQNGDLKSAERWFRQGAEMGDEMAIRNLEKCLQIMDNSQ